ncbi:TraB/GumN family protein [Nitrospira defluvii]|nr:TraB/GumN family protein [Nitrospira defluvii]
MRNPTLFRKNAVFIFCLLLISCSSLQKKVRAQERGLFWEVRSEKSQVYLLGSIHVAKQGLYPLPALIEDKFHKATQLVVEVDIALAQSGPEAKKTQAFIVQAGTYPKNTSLKENLSFKTYHRTKEKLKTLGLDIKRFDRFKPWLLVFTMTGMELERIGFKQEFGIDLHFLKKARGKKEVIELEGLQEQIEYLDSFSGEEQEHLLLYALADLEFFETQVDAMFSAWLRGDAQSFDRLITENLSDRPELSSIFEKLINERNRKMVSKIDRYLKKKGNYFIVVGAGHLVGKKGIVNLLREMGYQVIQL